MRFSDQKSRRHTVFATLFGSLLLQAKDAAAASYDRYDVRVELLPSGAQYMRFHLFDGPAGDNFWRFVENAQTELPDTVMPEIGQKMIFDGLSLAEPIIMGWTGAAGPQVTLRGFGLVVGSPNVGATGEAGMRVFSGSWRWRLLAKNTVVE